METKKLFRASFTLPNGKRKWVTAHSQEELDRKVLDLRMEANMGIDVCSNITFGEYALQWYRVCKEPTVKTNSRRSIISVINVHILPYLSGYPIRSITQVQVQFVFNQISGKSRSLNAKVHMVLNEIFDNAIANRVISISPMTGINARGKAPEKKEAVPEAEVQRILSELRKDTSKEGKRAYLFALLGFKTGLRRGELCALMLSDFDLSEKTLTVNRSAIWKTNNEATISDTENQTKTAAAHRTVPIPNTAFPDIRAAVVDAMQSGSLFLFHGINGNMMSYSSLKNMWNRVQAVSGDKLTMHCMRHTYCTRLIEKGFDIKTAQYLMGHSDPAMTLRIYTHFVESERFSSEAARVRACL